MLNVKNLVENTHALTRRNIWLLQAIYLTKFSGGGAGLRRLIGVADWLDHSIPTFAEFNDAVYNLKQAGLLVQKGRALKPSRSANILFKEFEAFAPLKQFEALCSKLSVLKPPTGSDPNLVTTSEIFLAEEEYANAVQAYTRGFPQRHSL